MLSVQCHTSLNTDCSCSYLLSTTPIIKLPILHASPAFPSFPWSPFDLAARPASQDFLKVVSLAPLLPVLREADIFRALIEKQWLDSWLAGLADNKACSSGLYLCSTCHLCVLEWILQARVCVFQSYTTLPLPVKCLQMPWLCSEAMTVCHCMGAFEPARRMHACTHFARVTVQSALLPMSWPHAVNLSTRLSKPAPCGPITLTHEADTVVFSSTPVLFTHSPLTQISHWCFSPLSPLSYTVSLSLLVTELFVLCLVRRAEWGLLGQDVKWTYRVMATQTWNASLSLNFCYVFLFLFYLCVCIFKIMFAVN